jgi:hypothetical protein
MMRIMGTKCAIDERTAIRLDTLHL